MKPLRLSNNNNILYINLSKFLTKIIYMTIIYNAKIYPLFIKFKIKNKFHFICFLCLKTH